MFKLVKYIFKRTSVACCFFITPSETIVLLYYNMFHILKYMSAMIYTVKY